jgi:hypothetical protein
MDFDGIPHYVLDLCITTAEGYVLPLREVLLDEINEDILTSKWIVDSGQGEGPTLAMLNFTTATSDVALITTSAGCFLIKNERTT